MGISAHHVSQQLLNQVRLSNLNFKISETPYSAEIILRKRFVKEASGPAAFQVPLSIPVKQELCDDLKYKIAFLVNENSNLKNQIKELDSAYKSSSYKPP